MQKIRHILWFGNGVLETKNTHPEEFILAEYANQINKTLSPGHIKFYTSVTLKTEGAWGRKTFEVQLLAISTSKCRTHTHIDTITGLLKYPTITATPTVLISYELVTSLLPSAEHFPSRKSDGAVQGQLSVRMGKQRMKLWIFIIFPIAWDNSLDFPTVSWSRVNWQFFRFDQI